MSGYSLRISTRTMMCDCEEDLDDFPGEQKQTSRIFSWSTSRRVERSMDSMRWDHGEESTTFRWINVLVKYEELIDGRLDLKVLEAEKRGPPQKNRPVGDAEMDKGLLDRKPMGAAKGVKYFMDTLRPLHQGSSECVPLEIFINSPKQEEEVSRWSSGSASLHCF